MSLSRIAVSASSGAVTFSENSLENLDRSYSHPSKMTMATTKK
jgi:hypothetical protein